MNRLPSYIADNPIPKEPWADSSHRAEMFRRLDEAKVPEEMWLLEEHMRTCEVCSKSER